MSRGNSGGQMFAANKTAIDQEQVTSVIRRLLIARQLGHIGGTLQHNQSIITR
jgi:hypothetical protein